MNPSIFDRYPELAGKPREMAMLCPLLLERGLHADALALGGAAIAAAPESLAVQARVRGALSNRVPSYHRAMLLDRARNEIYARALEAAVKPGMLVLEIGTGSGLLALIAARAGATVVTCEENPTIAAAAQAVVERNGLADRVRVLAKRSDTLSIPDDLPRRADLVIHEIFGCQLIDEGVAEALADARRRLLAPDALSIPGRAWLRSALVATDPAPAPTPFADIQGFDLSPFELLVPAVVPAHLRSVGTIEARSEFASALQMDFNAVAPFGEMKETIALKADGGHIDGIVQWIAIEFASGEVFENSPFSGAPASSWSPMFQQLSKPRRAKSGTLIDVTFSRKGPLLLIDVAEPAGE
jgi:type II protein arginine methyltransferase